jgi:SAM-dependent methyltransferase
MKLNVREIVRILRRVWNGETIFRGLLNLQIEKAIRLKGIVLDLGSGKLPSYWDFVKMGEMKKLVTVDILPQNQPCVAADLNDSLPFRSDSADTVMAMGVICYLQNYPHFLKEVRRIMKKSGVFFLYNPFLVNLVGMQSGPIDRWRFTGESLRAAYEEAGFREIIIISHYGIFMSAANLCLFVFNYFRPMKLLLTFLALIMDNILEGMLGKTQMAQRFILNYFIIARR